MKAVVLTAADRCDRCGVRAYVLVSVSVSGRGNHNLLFCAHDYQLHELKLLFSGAQVLTDQRSELQDQLSVV
jgi:hypothetical protein